MKGCLNALNQFDGGKIYNLYLYVYMCDITDH